MQFFRNVCPCATIRRSPVSERRSYWEDMTTVNAHDFDDKMAAVFASRVNLLTPDPNKKVEFRFDSPPDPPPSPASDSAPVPEKAAEQRKDIRAMTIDQVDGRVKTTAV